MNSKALKLLAKAEKNGNTFQSVKKDLVLIYPAFERSDLQTIYDIYLSIAYSYQRRRSQMETVSDRPFWQYTAVINPSSKPSHIALDGKVFLWNDLVWQSIYPPNGPGCYCRIRARSKNDIDSNGLIIESGSAIDISSIVEPGWIFDFVNESPSAAACRLIDAFIAAKKPTQPT